MIGWMDISQVCKLIACCAAADDVDGMGMMIVGSVLNKNQKALVGTVC